MAQGWQLARGAKLLGVSSVDCLAAQAQAERIFGRVNVMVDAQRNEFYLATYEISADGWNAIGPLRIVTAGEIQSRAEAREILIGPEVTRWFPGGRTIFPRAATLARLAVERDGFVAGEKLEPIYLREANFVKRCAAFGLGGFAHLEARDELAEILITGLRGTEQHHPRRLFRKLMRQPWRRPAPGAERGDCDLGADMRLYSASPAAVWKRATP